MCLRYKVGIFALKRWCNGVLTLVNHCWVFEELNLALWLEEFFCWWWCIIKLQLCTIWCRKPLYLCAEISGACAHFCAIETRERFSFCWLGKSFDLRKAFPLSVFVILRKSA